MNDEVSTSARTRWARFRFGIIAKLLSAPPAPGELAETVAALAATKWRHPTTQERLRTPDPRYRKFNPACTADNEYYQNPIEGGFNRHR